MSFREEEGYNNSISMAFHSFRSPKSPRPKTAFCYSFKKIETLRSVQFLETLISGLTWSGNDLWGILLYGIQKTIYITSFLIQDQVEQNQFSADGWDPRHLHPSHDSTGLFPRTHVFIVAQIFLSFVYFRSPHLHHPPF